MAVLPVTLEDGRTVYITIAKVPIALKDRITAAQAEIDLGRFSDTPPESMSIIPRTTLAMGRAAVDAALPTAGALFGAARGAQLGAPLGPWGLAAGGAAGAIVGGITGMAGREAVDLGSRIATGTPPRPTGDVMMDVFGGGAKYGLESTPPGAVVGGIEQMMSGNTGMGLLQATSGAIGLPQTPRLLGQAARATTAGVKTAAEKMGVDLTAAEISGSPFLKSVEAVLQRSGGGQGSFVRLGQRQNAQAQAAERNLIEQTTGRALEDAALRNNDFAKLVKHRFNAAKRARDFKEARFAREAGPGSPVDLKGSDAVFRAIRAEMPAVPSLVNTKLANIIEDYIALGRGKKIVTSEGLIASPVNITQAQSASRTTAAAKELSAGRPPLDFGQVGQRRSSFQNEMPEPLASGNPTLRAAENLLAGRAVTPTVPPTTEATKTLPLAEVRRNRTALGELAFPSNGAVPEVPQAQAQRLWASLTDDLNAFAESHVNAAVQPAWQEATEFTRRLHKLTGENWYKSLIADTKDLTEVSAQLFNPRNQKVLQDAKVMTSAEGWKLIQQQYFDDVFTKTTRGTADLGDMELGRQFADRIRQDRAVIRELLPPEQAVALTELAEALYRAEPTMSVTRSRAFTTGLMTYFQLAHVVASAGSTIALPWLLSKALTNPTTARMIAGAAKDGSLGVGTAKSVGDFLNRTGVTATLNSAMAQHERQDAAE